MTLRLPWYRLADGDTLMALLAYHDVAILTAWVGFYRAGPANQESTYTVRIVNGSGETVEVITGFVGEEIAQLSAESMLRVALHEMLRALTDGKTKLEKEPSHGDTDNPGELQPGDRTS